MSASRPSREVAHRLFAVEFDDATVSLTESDDDMAPSYVVTPTGALVNRAFVVGTLTSVDQVGDDIYRGRIADPTETFVTYAGQYQPAAANFLAEATTPAIVSLTGKARTFQPDGSDDVLSSLRPERIIETTATTRDHWVVETARHTLGRIELMARVRAADVAAADVPEALDGAPPHVATGIQRAIEHYNPSATYLAALYERAIEALEVVAGDREAVDPLMLATDADGTESFDDLAGAGLVAEWLGHDVDVTPPATPAATTGGTTAVEADAGDADEGLPAEATTEATGDQPDESEAATDELYELSDAEREAVEAEYDVGFETGGEIEAPDDTSAESVDSEDEPAAPDDVADPVANEAPTGDEDAIDPADDEPPSDDEDAPEDTDLEAAVLEHMRDLDDGDGVGRETLIEAVTEATGAATAAVDDAVQDALMSGSCYEPTEGRLKPI